MEPLRIKLPLVLSQLLNEGRIVEVQGATLAEALADLVRQRPRLGLHLFDDEGRIRGHILCACDGVCIRGRDDLDVPVRPGATITLLNSVSGG